MNQECAKLTELDLSNPARVRRRLSIPRNVRLESWRERSKSHVSMYGHLLFFRVYDNHRSVNTLHQPILATYSCILWSYKSLNMSIINVNNFLIDSIHVNFRDLLRPKDWICFNQSDTELYPFQNDNMMVTRFTKCYIDSIDTAPRDSSRTEIMFDQFTSRTIAFE